MYMTMWRWFILSVEVSTDSLIYYTKTGKCLGCTVSEALKVYQIT